MRGAIDAIYWKLHSSFLRNQRGQADRFLAMLEDEVKGKILDQELRPAQIIRYSIMRDRIGRGEYGRIYGDGSTSDQLDVAASAEASGPEAEFHKKLVTSDGRSALCAAVLADFKSNIVHEVDLAPYGRLDFLVRDCRIWTAVEVKMGEATHAVVSQIDKYRLALELDMCMGLHDEVRTVVMAEAFPEYVRTELSRMAVTMIHHDGSLQGLRRVVQK